MKKLMPIVALAALALTVPAMAVNDRPVVVDFRVDAREKVFPMVPAGMGNDELILPDSQMPRKGALK